MRFRWLLLAGLAVAGLALAAYQLERWRFKSELALAQKELADKRFASAGPRLEKLAAQRPGWGGGEVVYLLGLAQWSTGQQAAAIRSFEKVDPRGPFAAQAAVYLVEADVAAGHLSAAERRMKDAMAAARDRTREPSAHWEPDKAVLWLERLYRMEARFEEVRSLLQGAFRSADERARVRLLGELWVLDRGTVPLDGIRETLDKLGKLAPEDDRIWLGQARVAILEGRLDDAADWLAKCRQARTDDEAIVLAQLDWARAADRPDEVAAILGKYGKSHVATGQLYALRAWLAERAQGKTAGRELQEALEAWVAAEPNNPEALEKLAAVELEQGHAEQANAFRKRRAQVDSALDQYRRRMAEHGRFESVAERLAMAELALQAGRPLDAFDWCELAETSDPGLRSKREALRAQLVKSVVITEPASTRDNLLAAIAVLRLPTIAKRDGSSPSAGSLAFQFRDDASSAGLRFSFANGQTVLRQMPEPLSGGVAILDYDGDGWLDVFVLQGGPFPPLKKPEESKNAPGDRLFHNKGDGTFEDATAKAGLAGYKGYGHGVAVGDYDNDGRPDLFVTRFGHYALYHNAGEGRFEDVTTAAGLGGDRDWPTSAAWADLDGDGDLDLYVCHYLKWDPADPRTCRDEKGAYIYCNPRDFEALADHLFRNDGGRFVDVTAEAGVVEHEGRGLGVVAADLDDDGLVDLFVANDTTANFFFRNLGGLKFEEQAHAAGMAGNAEGGYQAGMGVACGDLDGDGRLDLAVTNFYGESTTLYRNLGGGQFVDATRAWGLALPSRHLLGFGIAFFDANNDGQLDVLTANGHLNPLAGTPYKMPLLLMAGVGAGHLRDVSAQAGDPFHAPRLGRALAIGDLDRDGRLDALIVDHAGPLCYLKNQTPTAGHWLELQLVGTTSNRDAVGAKVVVEAGGRKLVASRQGGGSYQAASAGALHFGLGSAQRAERIVVTWPSGKTEHFDGLPADKVQVLVESGSAKD